MTLTIASMLALNLIVVIYIAKQSLKFRKNNQLLNSILEKQAQSYWPEVSHAKVIEIVIENLDDYVKNKLLTCVNEKSQSMINSKIIDEIERVSNEWFSEFAKQSYEEVIIDMIKNRYKSQVKEMLIGNTYD